MSAILSVNNDELSTERLFSFFEEILNLSMNIIPMNTKENMIGKKHFSLKYIIDAANEHNLTEFSLLKMKYSFLKIEKINPVAFEFLFGETEVEKPLVFKIDLTDVSSTPKYTYSESKLITYMEFQYNDETIYIPIEKISELSD